MTCRIAINGYGRIGQSVLRALYESEYREQLEIVAINELSDIETISYLTRYDTTHGRFPYPVNICSNSEGEKKLQILNDSISVYRSESLSNLPWKEEGIDLVMECTGVYGASSDAKEHLSSGAKKVLFSQPADLSVDKTIVYGVNHLALTAQDRIVSNASCTTNAIIPVIKALHDAFNIQQGTLTTIHSAMNDQPTIDAYHHQDLRRTRSAMQNMVPVNTALAIGIERILPEMTGRLTAVAMRVPTINVSAIDLTVYVNESTTVSQVNQVLKDASQSNFHGVLSYTEEPLASSDFNHDMHSGIVDGSQTCVSGQKLIKILTWFDNEWAFANRMLDVAKHWSSL